MYKLFRRNKYQILRFILSGLIASSFNFFSYSAIYFLLKNIFFASLSGYFIGVLVSFTLAKSWVFKNSSNQPLFKSFSLFWVIYIFGGIEMSFAIMLLNHLTVNYKIAWFFGAFISALNNYLGSKYFLFKK